MQSSIGFWWILLAMAGYGVLHSILASLTFKGLVQRLFGSIYDRFYRLFFVLIVSVTFLPVLYLVWRLPDAEIYRVSMPWTILTGALQVACIGALVYALLQTGPFLFIGFRQLFQDQPVPPRFVENGLYGLVRHPLYTFSILLIWLTPVMSWNTLAFNLGVCAYMLLGSILEERKLVLEFGDAYTRYQQRVPALVPGLKRLLK